MRLHVSERTGPDYRARPAGIINVDDGEITIESGPPELPDFIDNLEVSASGDGEPFEEDDPNYALAVADSIERQSGWHYTIEDM